MLRTYKFKLYSCNKTKRKAFNSQIDIAANVYNHCIALHKKYHKLFGKSLNKFQLQKHLTKLKKRKKYKNWNNLGSQAIQNVTERIDEGYKKFFKKEGGLPSFKKRSKYKSFTLKGNVGYKLDKNKGIISLKGYEYKFFYSRKIIGNIKTITFKRDNIGDFYICISLEIKDKKNITTGKSVGIDFGLEQFLTLSDNTKFNSPLFHLKYLKQIKQLNKNLSKKQKGSNNRKRAKLKLAKLHKKVENCRNDYFHKLCNNLISKYDIIYIEDLNMKSMQKLWGRKVSDLAYSKFIEILSYKGNVIKIDRFSPSSKTCSSCGCLNENINKSLKMLKSRRFICNDCGIVLNRDYNASINIYRTGLKLKA